MSHEEKSTRSRLGAAEQRREKSRLPRGERGTSSTVGESAGAPLALTEKDIVRFWSKVDKNGPLPDQSNPHYAGLDRCWVWTAGKFNHGYGLFRLGLKTRMAHRVAWEITNGRPLPRGEGYHGICVIHRCDRKTCCNPSHLRTGSHLDNMIDRENKGRNNPLRGDAHPSRVNSEYMARGDRHGSRTKPERLTRGDNHYARLHPERLARGDKNGSRLHPERLARGVDQGSAKINDDIVRAIRSVYAAGGITQELLGAMFGISQANVSAIVRRKLWTHVTSSGLEGI